MNTATDSENSNIAHEAGELIIANTSESGIFYIIALVGLLASDPRLYTPYWIPVTWVTVFSVIYVARFATKHFQFGARLSPSLPFRMTLNLGALIWSCCIAWMIYRIGDLTGPATLAAVVLVAFLTGAVHSMYPVKSVMASQLLALAVPFILTSPFILDWQIGVTISVFLIVFTLYLWVHGSRQHDIYWQSRVDNINLSKKATELESMVQARTGFLSQMSHEIRTPLNGVLGMTQLLEQSPLDAQQIERVRVIKHSGNILLRLIDDVLELARLDEGKTVVNPKPTNLRDVIEDTVNLVSAAAAEKRLSLRTKIDAGVPEVAVVDSIRLQQVLLNLLWNAIKFTDSGHVVLSVSQLNGQSLRFTVIDSGIGIPENEQEVIFEQFTQLDNFHSDKRGVGLGLAISANLAAAMGGYIGLRSKPNQGSSFWIELPLEVPESKSDDYVPLVSAEICES